VPRPLLLNRHFWEIMCAMNRKRGRKSHADLLTPKALSVYPRLPMPPELSGDEAEVFLDIINTAEGDWFTRANLPLLVQYVRHIVQARRLAELIENCVGRSETALPYYLSLLAAQRAETAAIATLSVKMRVAQQSMRNNRGNPPRTEPPPWEFAP
jgi:hypothetical protein